MCSLVIWAESFVISTNSLRLNADKRVIHSFLSQKSALRSAFSRRLNLKILRGGGSDAPLQRSDAESSGWHRAIGVCYYPEHWPKELWEKDAADMAALGITYVRIGEFMWSTLQPSPPPPPPASAVYDWSVLDQALEILGRHGLKVILGTPTACPPKWLIDAHPDVLPYDARETPRKFGSRRHYSFSSTTFREHTVAICSAMAERYGKHPAVVGWQLDNEYGCHDTVRTYDPGARLAFREWLATRYGDVAALNAAWGSKFWSAEYRSFDEVDLPCGTVTEASPSHRLDFLRFSSDQVAAPARARVGGCRRTTCAHASPDSRKSRRQVTASRRQVTASRREVTGRRTRNCPRADMRMPPYGVVCVCVCARARASQNSFGTGRRTRSGRKPGLAARRE